MDDLMKDTLAQRRAADLKMAKDSLSAQKTAATAMSTPVTKAPSVASMATNVASKATGVVSKMAKSPAGRGFAPLSAGMTAAQAANTDTEDYAARIGATAGDSMVKDVGIRAVGTLSDLGNNLTMGVADRVGNAVAGNGFVRSAATTSNPLIPSANAAQPNMVDEKASAPNITRNVPIGPNAQGTGFVSNLANPASLNNTSTTNVNGAPGIKKVTGGIFKNPMYTDDPARAAAEFNQVQIVPGATQPTVAGTANNGIGTPGPVSGMSAALSAARMAAADRGDFESVRKSLQTGGGTWQGETAFDTSLRTASGPRKAALIKQMSEQNQQKLANAELAIKSASAKTDEQIKQQQITSAGELETLRKQIMGEKDPAKRKQLYETFLALSGKSPQQDKVAIVDVDTGQKDAMNQPIFKKGAINISTGELLGEKTAQGTATPYPEGAKLKGKDGKSYIVRNGQPVPA